MCFGNLTRRVQATFLAAALVLLAAPVHALPVDGPAAISTAVARLCDAFHGLVVGLWEQEGMSIDPNGGNGNPGAPQPPDAAVSGDEGFLIDPNG